MQLIIKSPHINIEMIPEIRANIPAKIRLVRMNFELSQPQKKKFLIIGKIPKIKS